MKLQRLALMLLLASALPMTGIGQSLEPAKAADAKELRNTEQELKKKQQAIEPARMVESSAPSGSAIAPIGSEQARKGAQPSHVAGDAAMEELNKEIKALEDYVSNLSPDADSPLRDRLAELYRARDRMNKKN